MSENVSLKDWQIPGSSWKAEKVLGTEGDSDTNRIKDTNRLLQLSFLSNQFKVIYIYIYIYIITKSLSLSLSLSLPLSLYIYIYMFITPHEPDATQDNF